MRAKLFRNGGSQAVRLPKDCRLPGKEVLVTREGDRVVLSPLSKKWTRGFVRLLRGAGDPSFPDRAQPSRADSREELE